MSRAYAKVRGVFERPKGSDVWWIRYVGSDGKLHREKIGRRSTAVAAYQKRQTEKREGRLFPEMIGKGGGIRLAPAIADFLAMMIVTKIPNTEIRCHYCNGTGVRGPRDMPCVLCVKHRYPVFRAHIIEPDDSRSSMMVIGKHGQEALRARLARFAGVRVEFEPLDAAPNRGRRAAGVNHMPRLTKDQIEQRQRECEREAKLIANKVVEKARRAIKPPDKADIAQGWWQALKQDVAAALIAFKD